MEKFQNNDAANKAIIIELNDVFLKIGNLCITWICKSIVFW